MSVIGTMVFGFCPNSGEDHKKQWVAFRRLIKTAAAKRLMPVTVAYGVSQYGA